MKVLHCSNSLYGAVLVLVTFKFGGQWIILVILVKICTTLQEYINFCFYHSYNYFDLSAAAAKNKLTVEVKYNVIQGLTVTV